MDDIPIVAGVSCCKTMTKVRFGNNLLFENLVYTNSYSQEPKAVFYEKSKPTVYVLDFESDSSHLIVTIITLLTFPLLFFVLDKICAINEKSPIK